MGGPIETPPDRSSSNELGEVELKGVPGPVEAWRVVGEAPTTGADGDRPLVGQERRARLLEVLLRRCEREGRPQLVTVVGPAGIGKSRLILEFTNAAGVRTVSGRCLPYGDGLRLWPFAEIVKDDASILDSDPPDVIEAKARERIGWRFDEKDGYEFHALHAPVLDRHPDRP